MNINVNLISSCFIFLFLYLQSFFVYGFDWATNEIHYQYGKLDTPSFAGGGSESTHIMTFQHASGWALGDNFLFIDHLRDENSDDFNNIDWYGEFYPNISIGKLTGYDLGVGLIRDIGILLGINFGHDARVYKYLPGIRFSWQITGFKILNTDITAYIDDSAGINDGGAPKESNSFMIDINGAYPFNLGHHDFSIEGHLEYIGNRTNELGLEVSDWFFSQIQFRYDMGKLLFARQNHLFIGVEWQIWLNKLGDRDTDENALQALAVWRF